MVPELEGLAHLHICFRLFLTSLDLHIAGLPRNYLINKSRILLTQDYVPPLACKFNRDGLHGNLLAVADEEGGIGLFDTRKTLSKSQVLGVCVCVLLTVFCIRINRSCSACMLSKLHVT